jgi:uncharacterized protein YegL
MNIKRDMITSITLSCVAHIAFLVYAAHLFVPAMRTESRPARKKISFVMKSLDTKIPRKIKVRPKKIASQDVLKFENRSEAQTASTMTMEELAERQKPRIPLKVSASKDESVLPEQKSIDALDETKKFHKSESPKRQRETRPHLMDTVDTPDADVFVSPEDFAQDTGASKEFYDKMPAFTPASSGIQIDLSDAGREPETYREPVSSIQRVADFKDYKDYLVSQVAIYQDPQDRYKYYKISIRIGEQGVQLASLPKEIIFLIDCSTSMREDRMEEFKKGISYALRNLNPGDTFNIFTFKKSITKFREASVDASEINIQAALRFVDDLTVGEKTDTYLALSETINYQSQIDPSYIILISDGRPTQGITNSRVLINQISLMNEGKKAIFAFTGGARVNRYLLDFIAYKNRGWTEYSYRSHEIEWHMANLYEKIRNPILTDIRYNISGLKNPQMYPKMLPDIFKNTEFTLYGRFSEEKEFLLRILGNAQGKTNELIIESSLKKATQGGREIARNWAFNKIYYLIGLLRNNSENKTIIEEINYLCNKFDIQTPYSGKIR